MSFKKTWSFKNTFAGCELLVWLTISMFSQRWLRSLTLSVPRYTGHVCNFISFTKDAYLVNSFSHASWMFNKTAGLVIMMLDAVLIILFDYCTFTLADYHHRMCWVALDCLRILQAPSSYLISPILSPFYWLSIILKVNPIHVWVSGAQSQPKRAECWSAP